MSNELEAGHPRQLITQPKGLYAYLWRMQGGMGVSTEAVGLPISAGMNITAEVKTGKRRVIEYLLSPVQRAASESLRER